MPNLKCDICNSEFPPMIEFHYIARNANNTGLAAAIGSNEPSLFDAFDCPYCGCQVIVKPRKRLFLFRYDEELTDEELLETMDDETIAGYLGLETEVVHELREEREEDDDDGVNWTDFPNPPTTQLPYNPFI